MQKTARKGSYDYYLILGTTAVLFIISVICIYGMFYFKMAEIHQLAPAAKLQYMERMNTVMAPFLICLILLLGICIPKRLLPTYHLNRLALLLVSLAALISWFAGVTAALQAVLGISLILQLIVLVLALLGSEYLHFEKKGYWVRVGSSLIHLGLILFVLDLFYYQHQVLHLLLFWITTVATTTGMICCFYADALVSLLKGKF